MAAAFSARSGRFLRPRLQCPAQCGCKPFQVLHGVAVGGVGHALSQFIDQRPAAYDQRRSRRRAGRDKAENSATKSKPSARCDTLSQKS